MVVLLTSEGCWHFADFMPRQVTILPPSFLLHSATSEWLLAESLCFPGPRPRGHDSPLAERAGSWRGSPEAGC